jgi:hypothetical protein
MGHFGQNEQTIRVITIKNNKPGWPLWSKIISPEGHFGQKLQALWVISDKLFRPIG